MNACLRAALALTLLASALVAPPAFADGQDSAAADALFRDGRALYEAKRYAEACPKFAESYRLDPASGSALALAACHESMGKLASAWSAYNETATRAKREGQGERAEAARQRAAELEPKLARMNISLAPGATGMDVTVKRDGVALGAAALGTPLPVDAGTHVIEASARGRKPLTMRVTIADGGVQSITIPPLQADDRAGVVPAPVPAPAPTPSPAPTAATPTPAPTPPPPPPERPASRATGSTGATLGLIAAGVGVVTMGAGGFFGVEALGKNSDSNANNHCVNDVCDAVGKQARLDARSAGNLSTILFAVGGGLTATGLVLFLVSGSSSDAGRPAKASRSGTSIARAPLRIAPIVSPSAAGLAVGGVL